MRSIALFPCSYTDGAMIIGELSTALRLRVYTDEMLFADISERFGVPKKTLRRMIFGTARTANGNAFEKEIFVDLARRSLAAQRRLFSGRRLFYGLHTTLLDPKVFRVLKVLIHDDEDRRVQRAMRQEGVARALAAAFVRQHDQKASAWTQFLFGKEAYDCSLYDVVLSYGNKEVVEVSRQIVLHYQDIESWFSHFQKQLPDAEADTPYLGRGGGEGQGIAPACGV